MRVNAPPSPADLTSDRKDSEPQHEKRTVSLLITRPLAEEHHSEDGMSRSRKRLETLARKLFPEKPPKFEFTPDPNILRKLIMKAAKITSIAEL